MPEPKTQTKILLIDPDVEMARLISDALHQGFGGLCTITHMQTGEKALLQIYNDPVDVILADVARPDPKQMRIVSRLIAAGLLVIALTDPKGTNHGFKALQEGADDYIVKDKLDPATLRRSIRNAMERFRLRTERGEAQRQAMIELEKKAITDSLTGLFNRTYVLQRMLGEIWRCQRYSSTLSLVMLDLDRFKELNNDHGHTIGDEVLKGVANVIQENIRSVDIIGRFGGEEFAILMPETNSRGALRFAERLRESIAALTFGESEGKNVQVTCSVGISEYSEDLEDNMQLVTRAEEALAEAKKFGRNQCWVYQRKEPAEESTSKDVGAEA